MTRPTIRLSRPDERERLYRIWFDAVEATHGFLAEDDFEFYAALVRDELLPLGRFWVAADAEDRSVGFLHLDGATIEALFVDPAHHGEGIGRALVSHARTLSPHLELEANEQSGAAGFYRRLGFRETGRSPVDGTGRPYPLIRMRLGG